MKLILLVQLLLYQCRKMNDYLKRTVQVGLTLGAIVSLVGCADENDGVEGHHEFAIEVTNGLTPLNGFVPVNGISALNGITPNNGMTGTNGVLANNGMS